MVELKIDPCGKPDSAAYSKNPWPIGTRHKVKHVNPDSHRSYDKIVVQAIGQMWGFSFSDSAHHHKVKVGDEIELVRQVSMSEAYVIHHPAVTVPKGMEGYIRINPEGNPQHHGWKEGTNITVKTVGEKCITLSNKGWVISTDYKGIKVGDTLGLIKWVNDHEAYIIHYPKDAEEAVPSQLIKVSPDMVENKVGPLKIYTIYNDNHSSGLWKVEFTEGGWVRIAPSLAHLLKAGDSVEFVDWKNKHDDFHIRLIPSPTKAEEPHRYAALGKTEVVKNDIIRLHKPTSTGATIMKGNIYNGQVIRTRTVQAGEGVSAGKEVSDILYTKNGFIAMNPQQAQAIVTSAAARALPEVNFDSATEPVEVLVQAVV